jgi:hypothetical protein
LHLRSRQCVIFNLLVRFKPFADDGISDYADVVNMGS